MKITLLLLTATTLLAAPIPKTPRNVSIQTKNEVYESWGIPVENRKAYVIDHITPLELGGTNAQANLQPQLKADAKRKDALENKVTKEVNSGKKSLSEAKKELANFHD